MSASFTEQLSCPRRIFILFMYARLYVGRATELEVPGLDDQVKGDIISYEIIITKKDYSFLVPMYNLSCIYVPVYYIML